MTVYERNVELLAKHHAELLNVVQGAWSTSHLSVEYAKNGAPRLKVRKEAGTIVDLHDPEDPGQVPRGTIEQMGSSVEGVTVCLGIELGYFARAFVRRHMGNGKARLVIYEADPAVLIVALETVDLTEVLRCPWVKIVVGPQAPLRHWVTQGVSQTDGSMRVVSYDPVFQLAPDIYGRRVEKELDRIPGIVKATKNAVIRRGPLFIEGVLKNVPHIMMAGSSSSLQGKGAGLPAIIVAAGPSLEKNVHHLRAAKGRSVIISADTALNYLLPRDIVPDVVVSVDPQEETYRKYQHLEIPVEVALVYHPAVSPLIVKHFPGPAFTMDTSMPVYQWLQAHWPEKGVLDVEAMCQAHVAFNLAEWMGCESIVFVGQDLSYNDERMHVKQGGYMTDAEQAQVVKDGIATRDIFGNPVKTNPTFVNYKAVFERKIRNYSGRVFQATEGGLSLEGAETCLLADVINQWGPRCSEGLEAQLESGPVTPSAKAIQEVLNEVEHRVRDLFRVERTSRHVCQLLESMKTLWEPQHQVTQEFIRLGKKVERLTSYIPRYGQVRELLHWMELELEIQLSDDTQALEAEPDVLLKHGLQLERGLKYYGGLGRVAPRLRKHGESLSHRLEQWLRLLQTEQQVGGPPSWLELAQEYLEIGLVKQAEDCLRRHVDGKAGHSLRVEEVILSIRIPLALHQLTQAVTHAESAHEQFPDNPEIKTLWSQAKLAWEQWQEYKSSAERQEAPRLDSHVQAGDFYHRIGNFAQARSHYRLALDEAGRVPDEAWDFFADVQRQEHRPDSHQEEQFQKSNH